MTTYAYNTNIPDGPNNPSNDQPKMQINTNNIDLLIDEDHISFGQANGGFHRHSRYVNETIPTLGANQSALYSKVSGQSQVFGTSDTGTNEYQLTRFDDANFTSFGQFAAYGNPVIPVNYTKVGGWTFLPGGLLMQYGLITHSTTIPAGSNQGIFPYPNVTGFTTSNITLLITPIWNNAAIGSEGQSLGPVNTTVTSTGFQIKAVSTNGSPSAFKGFYFTAIGV